MTIGLLFLQILFKSGVSTVLNHSNFEWNINPFSRLFRYSKSATEFLEIWKEVTQHDISRGFAVPTVAALNGRRHLNERSPSPALGTKRPATSSEEVGPAAKMPRSDHGASPEHAHQNPIDDSILSKRIGICYSNSKLIHESWKKSGMYTTRAFNFCNTHVATWPCQTWNQVIKLNNFCRFLIGSAW